MRKNSIAGPLRIVGDRLVRRWVALESDYKSVTVASGLVALVLGLGVRVPW